jgi:hypothetical protein
MKSKQQSPCSNCMHWTVTSWGNACSTCMHKPVRCMHRPVMSQANACTYCIGCKVSSLSQIYLYSSYFGFTGPYHLPRLQEKSCANGQCKHIYIWNLWQAVLTRLWLKTGGNSNIVEKNKIKSFQKICLKTATNTKHVT